MGEGRYSFLYEAYRKGSQEAARDRRYAFLHEVADKYGAASIALAHHADDQAETVMLHLLRGSGLTGLSGMKFKRREKMWNLFAHVFV